jgi:hypothetical protein
LSVWCCGSSIQRTAMRPYKLLCSIMDDWQLHDSVEALC